MRSLVLILLAVCFVSVSALAGFDRASAEHFIDDGEISVSLHQVTLDEGPVSNSASNKDQEAKAGKDECACKEKSDSLAFSCGVTLALPSEDPDGCFPDIAQAWHVSGQTDRNSQLMYLLKRPPRNLFQS